MNWSGRIFFYVAIAFLVFVLASGDGPKWAALFSKPVSGS